MGISTSTGTLTTGQSRTFNLSPASAVTLTLSPNVRVTITETPATVAATGLGGNASRVHEPRLPGSFTYGPYPMGGSVLVENGSNSGSSVAWVRSDSIIAESANGAQSLVDGGGNGFAPNAPKKARGMILFGDSFTAQSWLTDSTQEKMSSRGFANTTNMLLGNPLKPTINAGVSGNKVSDMLARIETDVVPYLSPGDVVFLQGGINDIVVARTAADIIADMQAICTRLVGLGALVSLGTICPSTLRITDSASNNLLAAINRGYRAIALATPSVYLSDDHAAMLLTTSVYANNIVAYSADSLHPNTLGAMAIARARAASLAKVEFQKWPLVSSNQDYKGLIYNPMAIGSNATGANGATIGTGITGNFCPNGWTVARTGSLAAVLSKVARSDGQAGEWARAAITGGSAGDLLRWTQTLTTSGVNWAATTAYPISRVRAPTVANGFVYQVVQAGTTGGTQPTWPTTAGETVTDGTVVWACRDLPVSGDSVEVSMEYALSGWTGNAMVQAYINWLDGGGTIFQQSCNYLYVGDTVPDYNPPTGVLYLRPGVIPAGMISGTLYVECITTAGATGNFDLSNVSARLTNR